MNTLQEVAVYLHQALSSLLTAVGVRPIPLENWPEPFRFLDKNIEWPPERASSVVQKPDAGLCMLIAFYDHVLSDIAVGYINERKGFSTLCKAFAREDGPFFMEASSRLEELRGNAEWRRTAQGISELSAARTRLAPLQVVTSGERFRGPLQVVASGERFREPFSIERA